MAERMAGRRAGTASAVKSLVWALSVKRSCVDQTDEAFLRAVLPALLIRPGTSLLIPKTLALPCSSKEPVHGSKFLVAVNDRRSVEILISVGFVAG